MALALLLASASPAMADASAPPWRGLSLTEALQSLQARGLKIVFTSQLVRPGMRVESEPAARQPRLILDEILAPHGLRARDGAGGTVVVVPAAPELPRAPGPAPPPEPEPLVIHEEIVVRPSELSLLDEAPLAPLSLSRRDIEALPHLAGDLFRALSLMPGIAANDVTAQFHIHGGRRDEVQVLLDGQEIYDAYHLQDFDRAVSVVEASGLSGASLSTGAFPASYGDRMSGVLDMTTTEPSGQGRTRLSLSLVTAVAIGGGRFDGDRGLWLASARRGSIDLASRLLGNEDPAFWDLYGKAGYRFDDRNSLRVHLLHAADTLDFFQAVGGEQKRFDTDYDSSQLWLSHQATLGERLLIETMASAAELDRDRRGIEDEEEQSFEILDRRGSEVLGLGQTWNALATARHTLKGGFEARRYEARYDYFGAVERDFELASELIEPRDSPVRFARRFSGDHLGVHLADRVAPSESTAVELGLRYDRHTLTGDTLWSPRLSVAWQPAPDSVVRASWGHFHQSQRPYELQAEDGETRFAPAERSEHRVLGYERLFGGDGRDSAPLRALRVEAYRRDIRNPRPRHENVFESVNIVPEVEPGRVRIAPDRTRSEGIEVILRGAAGSRSRWWVNYALASARDHLLGKEVRRQTDQTHTLNLYLDTLVGNHWSLSLAWRLHTGWPTTPVSLAEGVDDEGDPEFRAVLGPLYSERLPVYHRLDLRASREWQRKSGRLQLFFDLQNVYNRKNLAGFDVKLDEDSGELFQTPEAWPGFFPSLGVSWEF